MAIIGNKRGCGLLEIMVAMVIFLAGSSALLSLVITMVKSNKMTKERNYARLIAEQTAEDLRAMDYKNTDLENDGDNDDLEDIQTADHYRTITREGKTYNVFWNIAENIPEQGIKTIRIIVTYRDVDYRITILKGKIRR